MAADLEAAYEPLPLGCALLFSSCGQLARAQDGIYVSDADGCTIWKKTTTGETSLVVGGSEGWKIRSYKRAVSRDRLQWSNHSSTYVLFAEVNKSTLHHPATPFPLLTTLDPRPSGYSQPSRTQLPQVIDASLLGNGDAISNETHVCIYIFLWMDIVIDI